MKRNKCENVACQCSAEGESSYCSDYCAQAAEHGLERDYCQCEHEPACSPRAPGSEKVGKQSWGDEAQSSRIA
jgi:hypothetical protein